MLVEPCSAGDFTVILEQLPEFWGDDRTRALHHPMFIHEFGDTAFVIRDEGRVVAYLLGFISQTSPTGYVHMIATRASHRRKGLGERLWQHFIDHCRERGCTAMKAITSEGNAASIAFHQKLGMTSTVVKDYSGKGAHRVVFNKTI